MQCSYCGKDKVLTREHVFPNFLIKCFPECDVVFGPEGKYIGEQVVKDVCADCNNGELSYLDAYGKVLADQFLTRNLVCDNYMFEYDYDQLNRWLLKIAYNCLRLHDSNNEQLLKANAKYIIGENSRPEYYSAIFAGFFRNMTHLSEGCLFPRKVLEFCPEPYLSEDGILMDRYKNKTGSAKIRYSKARYLIRLGAGLFLIVLWEKDAHYNKIKKVISGINKTFPYTYLHPKKDHAVIKRCVDPFNMYNPAVINSIKGQAQADRFFRCLTKNTDAKILTDFFTPENINRGELMIKGLEFPQNKKVQRELAGILTSN